jgi:hypothetical protein
MPNPIVDFIINLALKLIPDRMIERPKELEQESQEVVELLGLEDDQEQSKRLLVANKELKVIDLARMSIPNLPTDLSDYDVTVTISVRRKPEAAWVARRQLCPR